MKRYRIWAVCMIILFAFFLHGNLKGNTHLPNGFKIAFIADAHFHDVYADFQDQSFSGLESALTGKNATIRTMQSQLMSTRLFNENYFALLATLDDIVEKKIKYVGLVGDFSDDGQPVHLRRLKEILDSYSLKYGIHFFSVHGNHDPGRPFGSPGGKKDFLGKNGQEQKIFSKDSKECANNSSTNGSENSVICTQEISNLGYEGILEFMGDYGFIPQRDYKYWTTPYNSYGYNDYSYEKAIIESGFTNRTYEICLEGTGGNYKGANYTNCLDIEDATYLVEPMEGIWLLAVDANVYLPRKEIDEENGRSPDNFEGSGNAGYNKIVSHKTHVIEWIKKVVLDAKEKGKILITFSHFPMVDFYDNSSGLLKDLFGEGGLDQKRLPAEKVTEIMAKTGVGLNIGGHMHFNDTGVREYEDGSFLVNVQVPSLAAFVPGYKILTVRNKDQFEIETVEINDVPDFNELFEHYHEEYKYMKTNAPEKLWNEKILESKNYSEYTKWHLTELTRKRFLPQWPAALIELIMLVNGKDLLILSQMQSVITPDEFVAMKKKAPGVNPKVIKAWKEALQKTENQLQSSKSSFVDFEKWNGFDLAVDFYRLMSADQMAIKYLDEKRLDEYQMIFDNMLEHAHLNGQRKSMQYSFSRLFACITNFYNSEPSIHFLIDFTQKKVVDLNKD